MPECPTTGYRWQLDELPPEVVLVNTTFELMPAAHAPGSHGIRTFLFRVLASGTHVVRLRLARAWESTPHEEAVVTIVVEPSG